MQTNYPAPGFALSRRGALGFAAGGLATLVCGDQALRSTSGERKGRDWSELSAVPAQIGMIAVPRRLSHPVQHSSATVAGWQDFKRRFITSDGRVSDNGNGGVAHSEGQGWGMLLAVALDDMAMFDLLHDWTRRNLQCRHDALHAWRYQPQAAVPVSDHNNASDGDLFIAGALLRAAWRWHRHELAAEAREIAADILQTLVHVVGGRTVLLPGAVGFEKARSVTVNPSYYIMPLFDELATVLPSPVWQDLRTHGLALLHDGRFGPWRLPPDWLEVDRATGKLRPDPDRPSRFSYDAVRVPLWLAWLAGTAGEGGGTVRQGEPALHDFVHYWHRFGPTPPAWIDVTSSQVAAYPAPPGMAAIGRVSAGAASTGRDAIAKANENPLIGESLPLVSASIDYYSAALTLVSRCVWQECCDA